MIAGKMVSIYTMRGLEKFNGKFDVEQNTILSTNQYGKYMMVGDGKTQIIRFKLLKE